MSSPIETNTKTFSTFQRSTIGISTIVGLALTIIGSLALHASLMPPAGFAALAFGSAPSAFLIGIGITLLILTLITIYQIRYKLMNQPPRNNPISTTNSSGSSTQSTSSTSNSIPTTRSSQSSYSSSTVSNNSSTVGSTGTPAVSQRSDSIPSNSVPRRSTRSQTSSRTTQPTSTSRKGDQSQRRKVPTNNGNFSGTPSTIFNNTIDISGTGRIVEID